MNIKLFIILYSTLATKTGSSWISNFTYFSDVLESFSIPLCRYLLFGVEIVGVWGWYGWVGVEAPEQIDISLSSSLTSLTKVLSLVFRWTESLFWKE